MAIIRGPLVTPDIATLPTTAGTMYANPASTKTFIKGITFFNGNTAPELVKLYKVPNSGGSVGTAGATNQFTEISLVAKETTFYEFPGDGLPFGSTNDTLQGVTVTANLVTYQLHGVKEV